MAVEWSKAPPVVLDIARRVIAEKFPSLITARIAFVFRSEGPESNGVITYGKARKVTEEDQLFVNYDFKIWLARDQFFKMSARQREALIFHELCHLEWDGETARIKKHDAEIFYRELEEYGFWRPHSDTFEMAAEKAIQQRLPIPQSEQRGTVGTIDFGAVAIEAEKQMRAEGFNVEVTATSKEPTQGKPS